MKQLIFKILIDIIYILALPISILLILVHILVRWNSSLDDYFDRLRNTYYNFIDKICYNLDRL